MIQWRKKTLTQLLAEPSAGSWNEIKRRLDLSDHAKILDQVVRAVRSWPIHVSRPPMKEWGERDPRLEACKIIKEYSTYEDYALELGKRILTKRGWPAVVLRRQFVGQVISQSTGKPMDINETGMLDMIGATFIERDGQEFGIYTEIEIKMDGGSASKEQLARVKMLRGRRLISGVMFGIEDAVNQVRIQKLELEQ